MIIELKYAGYLMHTFSVILYIAVGKFVHINKLRIFYI